MEIVKVEDIPVVTEQAPSDVGYLSTVFANMADICESAGGIGLSAVQVGIPFNLYITKVCYLDYLAISAKYRYFIDCDYKPVSDTQIELIEGCLSIKPSKYLVKRYKQVLVEGKEFFGAEIHPMREELKGIIAVVHQHEADHARGVLISDIGTRHE